MTLTAVVREPVKKCWLSQPVCGIDISCDFQRGPQPLQAPFGGRKSSVFFLRVEKCSILSGESHRDLTPSKARKYPVARSFSVSSPSFFPPFLPLCLLVFRAQSEDARNPGLYLSISLAKIRGGKTPTADP